MCCISSRMAERGQSFSSVAKMGNRTWWKVMKCYTGSRVRTGTGGWGIIKFLLFTHYYWGEQIKSVGKGWDR